MVKLGDDLESLKQEASEIAGVEKIVDLKMELTSLQNFNTESDAEQKRLEALIAFGRSQPDEADLAALRKDLGAQLKQTARKTATADRLAARKKKAALSKLKSKIATVRSVRGKDVNLIKRQIAAAKRKKREFINRLGKTESVNVDTLDF